jgi:two-component system, chemotaxis family, chemotaxis protein CheY
MSTKKVLSLGQCAADHAAIAGLLRRHLEAEVDAADTFADAESRLSSGHYDLVLVNRVLDRDGKEGLDFIARIKAHPEWRPLPVMLVSNYPDAQEQAIAHGALPGFGKSSLGSTQTLSRLSAVLGVDGESDQSTRP